MPIEITSGIVNTQEAMKEIIIARKPHLYDAGGDISKQWYINYYCTHPITGALEREKYSKGFTVLKTASERYAHADKIVQYIEQCLKDGVHPYYQDKILPNKTQSHNLLTGSGKLVKVLNDAIPIVSTSVNPKTLNNYKGYIKYFIEWLNTKTQNKQNLGTIDDDGADHYLAWLVQHKKLSVKTRNEHLVFFRAIFKYLKDKKKCLINPFESCIIKKHKRKYRQHYRENLRISIVDHLRETDPLLLLFIEMIYYTMRRNGEVMQLRISDIHITDSRIIFRPEINKGDDPGFVEISKPLHDALMHNKIFSYPKEYFLFGMGGMPGLQPMGKNNMYKRWRKVRTALSLPMDLGIYNWKHTSVIMSHKAGIPLSDIQAQGGWSSLMMVDNYMKDLDTHESEAIRNHMPAIDSRKHVKHI